MYFFQMYHGILTVFRHFLQEIDRIRQSNAFVDNKLVFCDELYRESEYGDTNNFVLHDDSDEILKITVSPPVIKFN